MSVTLNQFKKTSVHFLVASAPFLLAIFSFSFADAQAYKCEQLFKKPVLEAFNWMDNKAYIKAIQTKESLGVVQTFFSKSWNTQVYFTGTGLPDSNGRAPLVDPQAKAVYVFFHGSGTMKSSGRNFVSNMNTLAKLGYSAISFDMPFHANGPKDSKFDNSNEFMEWVKNIVLEVKKSEKPIFLAGHSFGPDVILEFITRYPKLVDGAVALSPASFNKELEKWYNDHTSKMKFGGQVDSNDAGGEWAFKVSRQFLWSKGKLTDPTVVNPNLNVRILSGNKEEYVPAPTDSVTGFAER